MNAVFHFIRKHDMIMSDKTKGEIMNRSLHCLINIIVLRNFTLGLEGIRHLIVKVAADMKAKKNAESEDIPATVYSLCVIHGCRNAKITDSYEKSCRSMGKMRQ